MIAGTYAEMKAAVKRLNYFRSRFVADGPFTSVSPFGRNLAAFYDHDEDMVSGMALCAGAGRILNQRCDTVYVDDDPQAQADIAAWWWRANEHADFTKLDTAPRAAAHVNTRTIKDLNHAEILALARHAKSRISGDYVMSPEQAFDEIYNGKRWTPPNPNRMD